MCHIRHAVYGICELWSRLLSHQEARGGALTSSHIPPEWHSLQPIKQLLSPLRVEIWSLSKGTNGARKALSRHLRRSKGKNCSVWQEILKGFWPKSGDLRGCIRDNVIVLVHLAKSPFLQLFHNRLPWILEQDCGASRVICPISEQKSEHDQNGYYFVIQAERHE